MSSSQPMLLARNLDTGTSSYCKPAAVSCMWPEIPTGTEAHNTTQAKAKLLDGPLLSVPPSISRLLVDLRNRQEMFFKQVLEHQELLRGQLLALQFSSQVSIDEQTRLKQRQEDLIAEFQSFSLKSRFVDSEMPDDDMKTHETDNGENIAIKPGAGSARSMTFSGDEEGEAGDEDREQQVEMDAVATDLPKTEDDQNGENGAPTQKSVKGKESAICRKLFGDMGMDKSQLDQEEYTVTKFYYETGLAQWIAKSETFSNVTLMVIFLNAVYIGYDADNNFEENLLDADLQFMILENAFCVFFFVEWIVRFLAFRRKCDGMKDMWFKFDTGLVTMMLVETWILPVALSGGTGIPSGLVKLVRLLRLARMARVMRAFPDLVAMVKGVKVASRAVGSALLMLVGLVYVFAIIMFTLLKDETRPFIHERFRRLGITMWTLLVDGTFLDGFAMLSREMMDTNHYTEVCILLLFVLASALTVMNMLIGVLCEVVSAVAQAEKEDSAIRLVKEKLLVLLKQLDEDGSGQISRDEIRAVLCHDDAVDVLSNLQVDITHLLEHLDMFFDIAPELSIQQIMDIILVLRGDRNPTMKDMLLGQSFSRWKASKAFDDVERHIKDMDDTMHRISQRESKILHRVEVQQYAEA